MSEDVSFPRAAQVAPQSPPEPPHSPDTTVYKTESVASQTIEVPLPDFSRLKDDADREIKEFTPPPPPAPGKKRRRIGLPIPFREAPLRKNRGDTPNLAIPDQVRQYVTITGKIEGTEKVCIQQRPQSKACGAVASLMLLSHFPEVQRKDSYWQWYIQTNLASHTEILDILKGYTDLSEKGYTVQCLYFHNQQAIEKLKQQKEETDTNTDYIAINERGSSLLSRIEELQKQLKSPLIISITNPRIEGHWIILDHIEEGHVTIRDPATGNGYRLLKETFYENWPLDDEVKVIYIERSHR